MRSTSGSFDPVRFGQPHSALSRRLTGAMSLVDVTCRLAAQHDEEAVLRLVTDSACEALNCERATLFLLDDEKKELVTRVATELEISEIRVAVGQGVAGWVAEKQLVANIPDPPLDDRWNAAVDRRTGFRTQSILAAPLKSVHDDRLIGVLQLLNRKDGAFDEFDEKLVQAFASHAATAIERGRLLEQARRSQEMKLAIDLGRSIQTGFLPRKLPDIAGYNVAAWWQPADEVSGDYYDVILLPDGRIGFVVADVSGHGVGPSLIMASVRAMLRVLCRTMSDPTEIVRRLSESIAPDLQEGRFITFLLGALDPETHEFSYCNAGHGPALCRKKGTGEFVEMTSTTWPIGIDDHPPYAPSGRVTLEPGDTLVLATDGAIELRNADREMFGRRRLEQATTGGGANAASVVESIRSAIGSFLPTDLPPDDITLLVCWRE